MSRLFLDSDLGVCQLLFPGVICLSPRGTFSLPIGRPWGGLRVVFAMNACCFCDCTFGIHSHTLFCIRRRLIHSHFLYIHFVALFCMLNSYYIFLPLTYILLPPISLIRTCCIQDAFFAFSAYIFIFIHTLIVIHS